MAINTSSNGTLSQDIVERILVQPLAQKSSFLSLGVPTFVSDGNPIHLPSLSSIGTATGFVAEGSEIAEASVATSEVVLLSSSVYAIKTLVKMSRESVETAAINLEAAMSQSITTRVGALVDQALWNGGTATTGSPVGVFQMTGVTNAGTAAGTALAKGDLIDMTEDYLSAYADENTAVWAMSPANWTRVQKFASDNGTGILQASLAEGAPRSLLGYPVIVTKHAPDTAIALFDRAQLAVGRAPASVTLLDQTFADFDQLALRVVARYDVKPLNAAAIVKLTIS